MNPRVLLLDDDAHIRESLENLLKQHDIDITACADPSEALDALGKERFDTIMVDIVLDDQQNGLQFVEKIQNAGNTLPVVVISGNARFEYAREALRLRVFDFIEKPFKIKQLIQCLRNAATSYRLDEKKKELEAERSAYQARLEKEVDEKVRQLRSSEEKYRKLAEQAVIGIAIIRDEKTLYFNPAFATIFECGHKGSSGFDFIEHIARHKQRMVRVLCEACLKRRRDKSHFQVWAVKCNQKPVYIDVWITATEYEERPAILLMCLDITDRLTARQQQKIYELELIKEHRMAAIGQLAAGIAHNMNTPISIIQGNAELLQLKNEGETEVEMILRQVRRINELIQILIRKGKKELNPETEEIDINSLIRHEMRFFKANLFYKHNVKTELDLDGSIAGITGRYSDLSQGIMAIVQNAVEAMQLVPRRELKIRTRRQKDKSTVIKISDTGPGMDQETITKIFNPFFSTKQRTDDDQLQDVTYGLGLYLAKNIFTKYNINVEVDSRPSHGTTFKLQIPAESKP